MKIITIIVTYNGEHWIERCINSLIISEIQLYIIVIDNNSTDSTVKLIKNNYPEVELIKSDKNLGFGKGNNIGLRKAIKENADYVFLLNQDAWIEPDTISKLIEVQKSNQEFGILSPFHLKPNKKEVEYYFSSIINPGSCPNLINDIYFNNTKDIYPIKFIHAAAWLISKKCLETVGGFDPIFPHYGEDEDYITRTHYFNFKTGIVPKSIVYHDIQFDIEKIKKDISRNSINYILLLKNINSSFRSNVLLFLKTNFDLITSSLVYRRFTEMKFRTKVFYTTLKYINRIKKSRKISLYKTAFLEEVK